MKLYIIRKYVMAKSIRDAIEKEAGQPVDEAWLDDDFLKQQKDKLAKKQGRVGF